MCGQVTNGTLRENKNKTSPERRHLGSLRTTAVWYNILRLPGIHYAKVTDLRGTWKRFPDLWGMKNLPYCVSLLRRRLLRGGGVILLGRYKCENEGNVISSHCAPSSFLFPSLWHDCLFFCFSFLIFLTFVKEHWYYQYIMTFLFASVSFFFPSFFLSLIPSPSPSLPFPLMLWASPPLVFAYFV